MSKWFLIIGNRFLNFVVKKMLHNRKILKSYMVYSVWCIVLFFRDDVITKLRNYEGFFEMTLLRDDGIRNDVMTKGEYRNDVIRNYGITKGLIFSG